MGKTGLVIGLHFLVISVFLQTIEAGDHREDLIQDSVRRLLGMKPGTERVVPSKNTTLPPRYVMDLYEKYRSGHTPMQGNTVRSILPMRDSIGEGEVLIFNLTSINAGEQILQSKLYLLKRRKAKSGRKRDLSNFRIKIGILPQMTSHRHIDVSLSHQKSEWHAYDITESVVQCRQSKKHKEQLLGVTLEVRRPKGSFRLVPFRRLLKHNSQPFVLIFSEDNSNQTRGSAKTKTKNTRSGIHDLLSLKMDHSALLPDDYSNDQDISSELLLRKKRSLLLSSVFNTSFEKPMPYEFKNSRYGTFENLHTSSGKLIHSSDDFSSIIENSFVNDSKIYVNEALPVHGFNKFITSEVFENSASEDGPYPDVEKLPKVLLNSLVRKVPKRTDFDHSYTLKEHLIRKRSISSGSGQSAISRNSRPKTFQAISDKHVSKSRLGRRKKQRNRRRKKKRKRNHKLPFWWTKHDQKLHSQDYQKLCQKKSLVVDFEKLGWGDWIMSPKSFNAYYCSGACSFPVIKDAHPSNHAAIQSLVHAMRLGPNVPAPCCVPSETKPLTLLYFDEHNSLVLKNYPNMIVEKCACR
ncbi:bone morphogenetic protein 3 [Trichonephila inaurata madagascariensis]|uniref:Bone morphogenetic protein 3 n=1 Tax=Trichonephila inaurata madagascariensis TaxID=2747483 RepID=A0A8X6WSQ6_9ARAC|nr:bone morphogenetic protein 3 [Trichonephila inaurata madagascariensis]